MSNQTKRFLDYEGLSQVISNVMTEDLKVLNKSKDYTNELGLTILDDGTISISHGSSAQGESIDVLPNNIEKSTVLGLFEGIVWDGGTPDTSWYDSESSEPQQISMETPAQVAGLLELINDGEDLSNVSITLSNDVDFAGSTITVKTSVVENSPLASNLNNIYKSNSSDLIGFEGNFDGNGHTISNLTLEYLEG